MAPDSLAMATLVAADPDQRHADIEFRHLRYFAVVAEELHFGRAAARLYISQPGLSQAIARLERELDVQLFNRTRGSVELTEAGTELLHRGRRLLADLQDAVTSVRTVGRGETGLVRLGVALLTEPAVAPALAAMEDLAWEPLRRGCLAVLASLGSTLALRDAVTLSDLRNERFLVNPRSLAPAAFEGLKLMCREFGGFDALVLESPVASTAALDTDWRPIREGAAIALMTEATARAVRPADVAVVSVQPPPQYVIALAWCHGKQPSAVDRFLGYLRSYRDQHAWITGHAPGPFGSKDF